MSYTSYRECGRDEDSLCRTRCKCRAPPTMASRVEGAIDDVEGVGRNCQRKLDDFIDRCLAALGHGGVVALRCELGTGAFERMCDAHGLERRSPAQLLAQPYRCRSQDCGWLRLTLEESQIRNAHKRKTHAEQETPAMR